MGDFELNDVLFFIVSKGGRVTNHELVTHFKNVLNNPNNKVKNRNKFKDYVNELATIKLDGGEKVLVLKKKYRQSSDTFGSSTSVASSASSSSLSASASLSSLSAKSPTPTATPTPSVSESELTPRKRPPDGSGLRNDSPKEKEEDSPVPSPRAKSEPPPASVSSSMPASDSVTLDSVDGMGMSRMRSDDTMDVVVKHSDRVPANRVEENYNNSVSGSTASLSSSNSQRSMTSSTSGVASMEDDVNASIISVKDKIKNLNKITSDTDISLNRMQKKSSKHGGGVDDDDASHSSGMSYVTLTAEQKEWMIVCAESEYHDMNRLLSKNHNLAGLKDFTNGYTALHWAAKSGKAEVIKLVANKPGVNVDQRSHGGYTALHLAALHGHEHIIELLVQTFKADADLRDYSGKKAKQYLMTSASSKAQQLLVSRRLGSDLHSHHKLSLDDSFLRSTLRMSNRAKAMSSLMQVKSAIARQPMLRSSWAGSTEDMTEEPVAVPRVTRTPPGSGGASPLSARKKGVHSRDMDLMPPPSNSMVARRMRYSDRSKSSSRESLTSPKMGRKNDENLNFVRSESDPNLVEGHTTV